MKRYTKDNYFTYDVAEKELKCYLATPLEAYKR